MIGATYQWKLRGPGKPKPGDKLQKGLAKFGLKTAKMANVLGKGASRGYAAVLRVEVTVCLYWGRFGSAAGCAAPADPSMLSLTAAKKATAIADS